MDIGCLGRPWRRTPRAWGARRRWAPLLPGLHAPADALCRAVPGGPVGGVGKAEVGKAGKWRDEWGGGILLYQRRLRRFHCARNEHWTVWSFPLTRAGGCGGGGRARRSVHPLVPAWAGLSSCHTHALRIAIQCGTEQGHCNERPYVATPYVEGACDDGWRSPLGPGLVGLSDCSSVRGPCAVAASRRVHDLPGHTSRPQRVDQQMSGCTPVRRC